MSLCEKCTVLPEKLEKLPPNSQLAHLGPEKRVGDSSPHFPKKYIRECPHCGTRWGIIHTSAWDSKWVRILD